MAELARPLDERVYTSLSAANYAIGREPWKLDNILVISFGTLDWFDISNNPKLCNIYISKSFRYNGLSCHWLPASVVSDLMNVISADAL